MSRPEIIILSRDMRAVSRLSGRLSRLGFAAIPAQSYDEAAVALHKCPCAVLLDRGFGRSSVALKNFSAKAAGLGLPVLASEPGAALNFPNLKRELGLLSALRRRTAKPAAGKDWLEPLLMGVSDGLISVDKSGAVNFMNAAAEKISGLSAKRCIGRKLDGLFRLVFEHGGKRLDNPVHEAMSSGKTLRAPLDIFLVAGRKKVPVGCKAAPVFGPGGAVCGAVLSLWDVTVQKKAKLELERSEEQYRTLVENAGSIILRTDISGKIIFFNEFGQRFFSCSEQQILGRYFDKALNARLPDAMPLFWNEIKALSEKPYSRELEHAGQKGADVWISWTYKSVLNKEGRTEILCVGTDVTPLKNVQRELAQANERLEQRVEERTRELVAAYAKIKEAHQVLIQMEKMAALGRFSAGIAHEIKNPLGIILSGTEYLLMKGVVRAQFTVQEQDEESRRIFLAALERDGIASTAVPDALEALNLLLEDSGLYERYFQAHPALVQRRDITRLAAASVQLRRVPRSELLPHEACAIEFLNRLCLEGVYPDLCPRSPGAEIYESLLKIKEAVLRADVIVKNLLKFSRPSEMKREVLPPEDMLEAALSNIPDKEKSRVRIETAYESGLLVEVDRNQLIQVFINLLVNALQSIPAKMEGRLRVTTRRDKGDSGFEQQCRIDIHDNGCGIKKEDMARLFEPFFTTKVYDKTAGGKENVGLLLGQRPEAVQGTGLGLSVSKAIVNNHKGEIKVASTEGAGTVVSVILPLVSKKA
ncbi:MAG: PAS domain S-box protein [Elusimicrobia bacterium]|nr:PAS domain S-box protein [Elusimicrobiota bacterium]